MLNAPEEPTVEENTVGKGSAGGCNRGCRSGAAVKPQPKRSHEFHLKGYGKCEQPVKTHSSSTGDVTPPGRKGRGASSRAKNSPERQHAQPQSDRLSTHDAHSRGGMTTTSDRGTDTGGVAGVPFLDSVESSRQLSVESGRKRIAQSCLRFTGSESWTACAAAAEARGSWAYVPPIEPTKPKPLLELMVLFVMPNCCRCMSHLQRRPQSPEFERGARFHLVQKSDSFRGEGDPAAQPTTGATLRNPGFCTIDGGNPRLVHPKNEKVFDFPGNRRNECVVLNTALISILHDNTFLNIDLSHSHSPMITLQHKWICPQTRFSQKTLRNR